MREMVAEVRGQLQGDTQLDCHSCLLWGPYQDVGPESSGSMGSSASGHTPTLTSGPCWSVSSE